MLLAASSLAEPSVSKEATNGAGDEAAQLRFRLLSVEDFRASYPPLEFAHRADHLDAVSCLSIIAPPELKIDVSQAGASLGGPVSARVLRPRFVAIFDAECSWWGESPVDPEYALQHEQVHFAIAEHQARKLTQQLVRTGTIILALGADGHTAVANLGKKLRAMEAQAQQNAGREHAAFDTETLADRSPRTQLAWVQRYERLLGTRLRPPATGQPDARRIR